MKKAEKDGLPLGKQVLAKDETNLKQVKYTENIIQKQLIEKYVPVPQKPGDPGSGRSRNDEPEIQKDHDDPDGQQGTPGTIDPKLQLLDHQLRNILKGGQEKSQTSSASDVRKGKNVADKDNDENPKSHQSPSPVRSPANDTPRRQLPKIPPGAVPHYKLPPKSPGERPERDRDTGPMEKSTITEKTNGGEKEKEFKEYLSSDMMRNSSTQSPGKEEILIVEVVANKHTARMVGSSEGKMTDGESRTEDKGELSQPGHAITFGGVEERSYTNLCLEDVPTNVYLDDHATRAAPYTVFSQFQASMVSSEEDTDDEHSTRFDSVAKPTLAIGQSPFSERRRGSHILKHIQDASEKINEKLTAREFGKRRELSMEFHKDSDSMRDYADESFSHMLSEHRPIKSILDEIPKPKFSTKSPSSPAKLSSLPRMLSSPLISHQQLFLGEVRLQTSEKPETPTLVNGFEHKQSQQADVKRLEGKGTTGELGISNKVTAMKRADEDMTSDGSDTEPRPHQLLKQEVIQQKLLSLKLEDRGTADGESPRPHVTDDQHNDTQDQRIGRKPASFSSVVFSGSRPAPTSAGPMIFLPFCNSIDAEHLAANLNKTPVENSIDIYRTKQTPQPEHDAATPVEEGFYLHEDPMLPWSRDHISMEKPWSEDRHVVNMPRPASEPAVHTLSNMDNEQVSSHLNNTGARPKTLDFEHSSESSSRSTSDSGMVPRKYGGIQELHHQALHSLCLDNGRTEDFSLVRASVDVLMDSGHVKKPDSSESCRPPRPPRGSRPAMVASRARSVAFASLFLCARYSNCVIVDKL